MTVTMDSYNPTNDDFPARENTERLPILSALLRGERNVDHSSE